MQVASLVDVIDIETDTSGMLDSTVLELGNDDSSSHVLLDDAALENESCGICMDVVIDRGVLDSCNHWFCFACIDNWATIANLCPLCKNEFQMITCIPVYDTIGSSQLAEDSLSRAADWSIQGDNNTLSFPSYYIDENAVICLDGDGCKIRNGLASTEEELPLDTSIACDSCDIWYHAFCVGFDPNSSTESSWLCRRCIIDETPQNSDGPLKQRLSGLDWHTDNDMKQPVEAAFSGKVSITVADAGETAVVVSLVEEQKAEVDENFLEESTSDDRNGRDEVPSGSSGENTPNVEIRSVILQANVGLEDSSLALSLSRDASVLMHAKPSQQFNDVQKQKDVNQSNASSAPLLDAFQIATEASESSTDVDLQLGLSMGTSFTGELSTDADENVEEVANRKSLKVIDVKRKSGDDKYGERDEKPKVETGSAKRAGPLKQQANSSTLDHKSRNVSQKKTGPPDIMRIVQEAKRRKCSVPLMTTTNQTPESDHSNGLRVKKIMRRAPENESSSLLQKLRMEIREAVRNKASIDPGKIDILDSKLLSAFRAAITGPRDEPQKKMNPNLVKARKLLLQKGKVRENLTKKIYGTASGRRRKAWDRDWEIEFWKHRCMTGPAKIDTLKSVLDLLKRSSDSETADKGKEAKGEARDSILSRLYLADASVFPRKEDIKPLSASDFPEQNAATTPKIEMENTSKTSCERKIKALLDSSKSIEHRIPCSDHVDKTSVHCLKNEAANKKIQVTRTIEKPSSNSTSKGFKGNGDLMKENPVKSDDIKFDKRKWALEVLARKTASLDKDTGQGKRGDKAMLKGNYPLLAQLPEDMRPNLLDIRHNKVPVHIRQAQLYRLTEHYLKQTNLPVIHRTAETELAVADAVNIEKDICERSCSKLVYLNLCSQMLYRLKHTSQPKTEENVIKEDLIDTQTTCENAEEALKLAGLISDSPASSPTRDYTVTDLVKVKELDNVFDLDTNPEVDIYGDFEYNLDEEEYIASSVSFGASNMTLSQPEVSNSKMKVIFSSITCESSDTVPKYDNDILGDTEVKFNTPYTGENLVEVKSTSASQHAEGIEDLSSMEYEELYGPDKEPMVNGIGCDQITVAENKKPDGKESNENENCTQNNSGGELGLPQHESSGVESSLVQSLKNKALQQKDEKVESGKQSDICSSVSKKVEAYIKEHIRPLCTSGVITTEQYRWAVSKTTEKVMKFHRKAKNANFLVKEGEKVKKLAEQYVEAAQAKK